MVSSSQNFGPIKIEASIIDTLGGAPSTPGGGSPASGGTNQEQLWQKQLRFFDQQNRLESDYARFLKYVGGGEQQSAIGSIMKSTLGMTLGITSLVGLAVAILGNSKVLTGILRPLFDVLGAVVDTILAPLMPIIAEAFQRFTPLLITLASWLAKVVEWTVKVFDFLGAFDNWFRVALGIIFGPLGLVVGYLVELLPGFINWIKNIWPDILEKAVEIWDSILGIAKSWWNNLWTTVSDWWGNLWNTVSNWWGNLWTTVNQIWNQILIKVKEIWDSIYGLVKKWWDDIWKLAESIWNWILDKAVGVWNSIWTIASEWWGKIWGIVVVIWDEIKTVALNFWNAVKLTWDLIASVIDVVKSAFSATAIYVGALGAKAYELWQKFIEIKDNIIRWIQAQINAVWGTITGFWSSLVQWLKDNFRWPWQADPNKPIYDDPMRIPAMNRGGGTGNSVAVVNNITVTSPTASLGLADEVRVAASKGVERALAGPLAYLNWI